MICSLQSADSRLSASEDHNMREFFAVVSLVFFVSTPAVAQGFMPLPNQLSLGIHSTG